MKRSQKVRLILISGLSAGTLTGCDQKPNISTENVYTNNFYVPGAGYYHAPFRAWYPLPYNQQNPDTRQYYYGGQWSDLPAQSITNISSPTDAAAELAQASRTDISRGGFGHYGGYSGGYSGGYYGGGGYYGSGSHGWGVFS